MQAADAYQGLEHCISTCICRLSYCCNYCLRLENTGIRCILLGPRQHMSTLHLLQRDHHPGSSSWVWQDGARKLHDTSREFAWRVQVLSHPQFQADPVAAIAHHLNANLPPAPEPPKPKADRLMRKQQKARRKFEKRLQKSSQGMDEDSD